MGIERVFHVGADELYRAWTEPEQLRRWFRPLAGLEAERLSIDARPGGAWSVEFVLPEGRRVALEGRYREVASQRVVFDLARRSEKESAGPTTLVTVELQPRAGATTLVLRHEGIPDDERSEVEHGWHHCLGRLAGVCQESLDRFYGRLEGYPRFFSRFGGFWPDLSDAEARIAGKQALGQLTAEDAAHFRHWVAKGYAVFERAVAPELVDRLRAEMDEAWATRDPRVRLEVFERGERLFPPLEARWRDRPHKVLDFHGLSKTARDVQFAPAVQRFLAQLFERPALAFQSLYFRWGTEQDMHQDTAYVVLRSPMELVGCWIALEDITPGSGELQYYVGSHRIPEFIWFGRGRSRPYEFEDDREFLHHVRAESERLGCPLVRFHPKKGDVLLWHADLVHGGSKRELLNVTRQSLVTHFCPLDVDPEWLDSSPKSKKLEHAPGCFYCYPQQ